MIKHTDVLSEYSYIHLAIVICFIVIWWNAKAPLKEYIIGGIQEGLQNKPNF